jgi:hypothetical protein
MDFDNSSVTPLPVAIRVENLSPAGWRYVLPRRQLGRARLLGLAPIGGGICAALFALEFLEPLAQLPAPWATVAFAVCALIFGGGIVTPIALGLAILCGHSEIEIGNDRLLAIERVGIFRVPRRRRLDDIQSFVVAGSELPAPLDWLASIKIEDRRGKSLTAAMGYPREMLVPLAHELARQCRIPAVDPFTAPAVSTRETPRVSVLEQTGSFGTTSERHEQPAVSKIVVDEHAEGVTFAVPAAGLLRGSAGLFGFACVWLTFMAIFTGVMCVAGVQQQQQQPGGWGLLGITAFVGMFWLVGAGLMYAALNMARRRATFDVAADRLNVSLVNLLGEKNHSWSTAELRSVGVGPSGVEVNDRPLLELQVLPVGKTKAGFLAGRDVAELEWLATRLRRELHLPPPPEASDNLPDVDRQPEGSDVQVQELPSALVISVPRASWWKGPLAVWIAALIWDGIVAVVGWSMFSGPGGIDPGACVFLAVFAAIGLGIVAGAIQLSIRRVEFAVAGDRLLVLHVGLSGRRRQEWAAEDLVAVRAAFIAKSTSDQNAAQLQIVPAAGKQLSLLSGRDQYELAWIATLLRRALDVPAEAPQMNELPASSAVE